MGSEREGCSYPLQLPLMLAPGALEAPAPTETSHATWLVPFHPAGESGAFGTEVAVAFDEVAFEVADLENLHRSESDPELIRPRHLHLDATTRKERGFSLTNLEGGYLTML